MSLDDQSSVHSRPHLDPQSFRKMQGPLSMLDEDGKPTWAAKRHFHDSFAYKGTDLNTRGQRVHAKVLPEVERLFEAGDLDGLMDLAELTSPTNYKNSGIDLGSCQTINDLACIALAILIGENAIRQHQYNYQPSFGQESHEVAMDRAAALSGAYDTVDGGAARKEAADILKAKNPEPKNEPLAQNLTATALKIKTLLEQN